MNKIIIEVGSTNTKIDIYDGKDVKRFDELMNSNIASKKLNNPTVIDLLVPNFLLILYAKALLSSLIK